MTPTITLNHTLWQSTLGAKWIKHTWLNHYVKHVVKSRAMGVRRIVYLCALNKYIFNVHLTQLMPRNSAEIPMTITRVTAIFAYVGITRQEIKFNSEK